jgi:hypothetical protein
MKMEKLYTYFKKTKIFSLFKNIFSPPTEEKTVLKIEEEDVILNEKSVYEKSLHALTIDKPITPKEAEDKARFMKIVWGLYAVDKIPEGMQKVVDLPTPNNCFRARLTYGGLKKNSIPLRVIWIDKQEDKVYYSDINLLNKVLLEGRVSGGFIEEDFYLKEQKLGVLLQIKEN